MFLSISVFLQANISEDIEKSKQIDTPGIFDVPIEVPPSYTNDFQFDPQLVGEETANDEQLREQIASGLVPSILDIIS